MGGGDQRPADALRRLITDDVVGQLRRREGRMARLGSEGAALKLDWVEAIAWQLAHPASLAQVEAEARELFASGVRHIVWAGMGGSVLTVRVLQALGFSDGPLTITPLDSTDPEALNALVRSLATAKGIAPPPSDTAVSADHLRILLDDVALVAVAMGMTSAEPITHLQWFSDALSEAGLPPAERLRAMSLPNSYLDRAAAEQGVPRLPLQLDGGSGTGGRMSAPGTRVFLLPVACWLVANGAPAGSLERMLRRAWEAYDLAGAERDPAGHRFVRLAAALSEASQDGVLRLTISAPGAWEAVRDWAEQLFEESLGKAGKGIVVFAPDGRPLDQDATLGDFWLRITDGAEGEPMHGQGWTLSEPLIASADGGERLAGLATLFLGLQLSMALFGYLHDIPFAGQPAVEDYKSRAAALVEHSGDPVAPLLASGAALRAGEFTLLAPEALLSDSLPQTLLTAFQRIAGMRPLPYLDVTINGEAAPDDLAVLRVRLRTMAVGRLGVPFKLRRAPAAYHASEQSEMDGPTALVSVRALALRRRVTASGSQSLVGAYDDRFLRAQSVATWQAMNGVGRACLLLLYDGYPEELAPALAALFDELISALG